MGEVPEDAVFSLCDPCLDVWSEEIKAGLDSKQADDAAKLFIAPEGMKVAVGPDGHGVLTNE
jgi:hypothetical protein